MESALYDAAFEIVGHEFQQHHLRAAGSGFTPPTRPGTAHYRCADDRWIHLCLFDDRHLRWFGETFAPEWTAEGLFDGDQLRAEPALQDEFFERLTGLLATRTGREWEVAINERSGAPAAICQTAFDWLTNDEHARDSGAVIELVDSVIGATAQLGCAIDLDVTPLAPHPRRFGPPPSWEPTPSRWRVPDPTPMPNRPALDGVRVVDFTEVLAGPTCARVLAEYGATVIKVNKPTDRAIPWHAWINRAKQSILLDISDPSAAGIVDRLLSSADVVCQNFTNGVADRLGIGESSARAKRADVIYTSISAFGRHGVRAGWRGREELGQAVTGLQTSWATDDGEPAMNTFPVADIGTGHLAALGVLLALFHRQRTGQGQSVAASLAQTATLLQAPTMVEHAGRRWDEPAGQHAKGWSPDDHLYEGSDGRWLYVVGAGTLGLDEATFATRPAVDWINDLNAQGHTAQLVITADELVDDPIARQRGLSLGDNVGTMPRLSATPARAGRAAPPPGSDGRAVLEALDCLDQWDTLTAAGVIIDPVNSAHAT